jgi:hypothetical protein
MLKRNILINIETVVRVFKYATITNHMLKRVDRCDRTLNNK